jgi:hypothetical protein
MEKNYQFIETSLLLTTNFKIMKKELSIYDSVKAIKRREQQELADALRKHGSKVDNGYEFHFEDECPIIGAYDYEEPCDVVILSARIDKDGYLKLIGDEKNDRGNPHSIDPDDVFAGQLEYVTSSLG